MNDDYESQSLERTNAFATVAPPYTGAHKGEICQKTKPGCAILSCFPARQMSQDFRLEAAFVVS